MPADTENERAAISKLRGAAATQIADPDKKKEYIAEQGRRFDAKSAGMTEGFKQDSKNESALAGTGMPKMHKGGVVKKDGPHNLQKGEVVIAKDKVKNMKTAKAMMAGMEEGAADAKDKKDKKPEPKEKKDEKKPKHATKRPRHMHIERANGGFIVKHDYDMPEDKTEAPMQPQPPTVLPDMAALHAHVAEHMAEPEPGEAAEAMGAGGAQQ